jgi:formylglycine-generating enzyme required for sulfatase activity
VTYDDPSFPATVRDFYLDEYEVSVGRFRKFVSAWVGGWRPAWLPAIAAGIGTDLR